jgi:hypothetical protein
LFRQICCHSMIHQLLAVRHSVHFFQPAERDTARSQAGPTGTVLEALFKTVDVTGHGSHAPGSLATGFIPIETG